MMFENKKKAVALLGLVAGAALALSACAGPSSGGAAGGGESETGSTAEGRGAPTEIGEFTTYAEDVAAEARAEQENTAPTEGPEAVEGKKIAVIPCSMAAEGCARPANAAVEAAQLAGWSADILDPGGDPSKMAALTDQAVSTGYDAIVYTAIDVPSVQASVEKAINADVLVGNFAAADADPALLTTNVPDYPGDFFNAGYAMGAQMFVDQGPDLKIAMLTGTEFGSIRERLAGTKAFVEDCQAAGGGCEILAEENFLVTDLVTSLPGQTAAMVRSNPDANALWFGYDAGANFGIQGLEEAGLEIDTYAFDANVANIQRIADDRGQAATAGSAMKWIGLGIIDNFNRVWAGEEAIDQGMKFKLLTSENLPANGEAWDGDVDVTDNYKKIWGVS